MARQSGSSWSLCAVVLSCIVVLLLLAGGSQAQSIDVRIRRQHQSNARVGGDFYAFSGTHVEGVITSLEWLKNGVTISTQDECFTFIETLEEIDLSDEGRYECRATFANGTTISRLAGTLHTFDPSTIEAPPLQYGLLNHNLTLSCATGLSANSTVSITWQRGDADGPQLPGFINSVSLAHEGEYVCKVYLGAQDLEIVKEVEFIVLVPPMVLRSPPTTYPITGNQQIDFVVDFQSRFQSNTSLLWYKDEQPVPEDQVTTEYRSDPNASTKMSFNPIMRRNGGAYRVVIENKFNVIPLHLQQIVVYFEVTVTVPPAVPTNIQFADITSNTVNISWTRTNKTTDDAADRITLFLKYINGTIVQQLVLDGGAQGQMIENLIPGMGYNVLLAAHNQDDTTQSPLVPFATLPGPPAMPDLQVTRHSDIAINLTAILAYTGGGDITHLVVEFRQLGTTEWISIGLVEPLSRSDSGLELDIIIEDERFSGIGIEFRVSVMNSHGHGSVPRVGMEEQVLPGSPSELTLVSSSYHTLTVVLQLSSEGTSPIRGLLVEFLSHTNLTRTINGPFTAGEPVEVTINDLDDGTTYVFTLAAYNFGGIGAVSSELEGTTDKLPLIPLYGIIAIGVGFAVVLVVVVIIVVMVTLHCCKMKRRKREYYINPVPSADEKQLESNHEMIKRTKLPSSPHPSTSTPSVLTTITSSHSLFSQTPVSPQRSGTESPRGHKFHLDAGSSVTNSVNQDSDESEINAPRYTYAVSTPSPAESETHLRTQSSHSVATTATRMSVNSIRESLIYPVTKSNATDV